MEQEKKKKKKKTAQSVKNTTTTLTFLNVHKVDIAFIAFCITVSFYYNFYISKMYVPSHDGAAFLTNARGWLTNSPIWEIYRPPLLSWIISGMWAFTGEYWILAKYLNPIFTISAGIVLYLMLRKHKGSSFAFGVTSLTMINGPVFFYSTQIMSEGLSLFFLILTLYFLKSEKKSHWFLAGIAIGLTFASRYPIVLQALVLFAVETIIRKNPTLFIRTIVGAAPTFALVILLVFLKTGTFQTALGKDTTFSLFLSPFYLLNSFNVWGLAFMLTPIALLFKRTYSDKYNYTFIAWFIVSLLFWSASSGNWQTRFTIQFTPAVYYLAVLGIENITKTRITRKSIRAFASSIRPSMGRLKERYRYQMGDW